MIGGEGEVFEESEAIVFPAIDWVKNRAFDYARRLGGGQLGGKGTGTVVRGRLGNDGMG
jgi:hypothetical protein